MTRLVILAGLAALTAGALPPASGDSGPAQARQAAAGTAAISGQVVTADESRRPVRRAVVQLTGGVAERHIAVTSDDGRFEFRQLPAGRYTLVVSKPAYASTYYGARRPHRPPGTPIVLADAEHRTDIVVPLARGAVIAGTVRGAGGQPVPNARVVVLEHRTTNGRRMFVPIPSSSLTVDDRGEYRLYGLPPGSYVVGAAAPFPQQAAARPTSAAEVRWAQSASGPTTGAGATPLPLLQAPVMPVPVYYPGTADPDSAEPIEVGPADERTGIDLILQTVTAAQVDGVVLHPDGRPAANSTVLVVRPGTVIMLDSPMRSTRADASGRFVAQSLRPGRYTLFTTASSATDGPARGGRGEPGAAADLWASEAIEVAGRDIEGLRLVLQPGMTLSGRVVFDAASRPPPEPAGVRLNLTARAGDDQPRLGVPYRAVQPDGTFEFRGIAPGAYQLTATVAGGTPQEWMARSAVWQGTDLLEPFEILPGDNRADVVVTMTDRLTELSGTIFDARGEPAPDFSVLVFPVDRTFWVYPSRRIRSTRPGTNGEFRLTGLPPGDYFVAVLVDTDGLDFGDAGLLDEVSVGSVRVRLAEGEKTRQDVRLAGGT
jgi:uncharacterized protein (DUF2141 family)